VATILGRMARQEKPYRVYRGGRTKGKVPSLPRPERPAGANGRRRGGTVPPGASTPPRRRARPGRRIALGLLVLLLLVVAWAIASFIAFRQGVADANARLPDDVPPALVAEEGMILSKPTTVLLLGTDHAEGVEARRGARRSDSIMLVRTDPRRGRLAYLSIPRDLRVDIPGHGSGKINSAMQLGGPALAIATVRAYTGLPVNHVAVIDFGDFRDLIDTLGGITVDVPDPILSNRFDCPYATQERCQEWQGWRFSPGKQELDGRRALVYSRIRENRLDPTETDITRGERQQQVVQAIGRKVTSPLTLARMPLIGDDILRPLATDLSAWQVVQLGWRKFRSPADRTLHCRLGGTGSMIGGQSFIVPTEENISTIAMFTGASAPQPPPPGSGPFGPGCIVGGR
jgi:polyisoprenyl-teichoic acid--peptidoglycan teichoic acid transferase